MGGPLNLETADMVTSVAHTGTKPQSQQETVTGHPRLVSEWRLVDHFNTVEEAERVLDQLRHEGIEAEVSLIDGLSVIARRVRVPDPSLC